LGFLLKVETRRRPFPLGSPSTSRAAALKAAKLGRAPGPVGDRILLLPVGPPVGDRRVKIDAVPVGPVGAGPVADVNPKIELVPVGPVGAGAVGDRIGAGPVGVVPVGPVDLLVPSAVTAPVVPIAAARAAIAISAVDIIYAS